MTINLVSSDHSEGRISSIAGSGKTVGTESDNLTSYIEFAPANWNSLRTVRVRGYNDNLSDGDQAYAIHLSDNGSTTEDLRYRFLDPPDVTLTNLDLKDTGGVVVSAISNATDESGTTACFTIRLRNQPSDNVTVNLVSSDPSEGRISSIDGVPSGKTVGPSPVHICRCRRYSPGNWRSRR